MVILKSQLVTALCRRFQVLLVDELLTCDVLPL